jgi:hypothetical protein
VTDRPVASFDLSDADSQQVQETTRLAFLALELRRLGTDEDVRWAQDLTMEMIPLGDAGPAWWAERVEQRLAEITRRGGA